MTLYSVLFYCEECHEVHPLGVSVNLDNGPDAKTRVSDLSANGDLDPYLTRMTSNKTTCPNTGQITSQSDHSQLFLIPISHINVAI